jgi:hypothetical protein
MRASQELVRPSEKITSPMKARKNEFAHSYRGTQTESRLARMLLHPA